MKKYISLSLLLIVTLRVYAQNLPYITNPPDFGKLSWEDAKSAVVNEESKNVCRPAYITNLFNQIQSGQLNHDNEALAIDLLGYLRPTNSYIIEFLIQNIDFERKRFSLPGGPSTELKYPCEGALMKTGQPVVIPILNHLTIETNELRRHLMCDVLAFVDKPVNSNILEGKKLAQQQISQKLAAESDATKQANLKAALKELEE
jgi:hypothetical protein